MEFETAAIHVGEEPNMQEGGSGDVAIPIHLSSTFARRKVDRPTGGYEYSRTSNPTRHALEMRLAALEDAKFGLAFSSGLGAETSLFLALLKSGDHVIAFDDLYGGTRRLIDKVFASNFKVSVDYVDARSVNNVERAFKKNTKLVWLETPTNPLMKLCDIAAISKAAKTRGAIVVVDNTFATPYFQRPLALSADIVLHSTTKYINGHSDSVGGAIMLSDRGLYEQLKFVQNAAGAVLSPFDSFLVMRGAKTLAVRMREHARNAAKVAAFLESSKNVRRVYYPGLKSHPQYELAKKQMGGFGGMLSFEIDGDSKTAAKFLQALKIFSLAESLGGVESLAEHPASMTHASVPKGIREKVGIGDSLVRLSVGIENADDLIGDVENALRAAIR
jgi:cystathionine gamma-lyase